MSEKEKREILERLFLIFDILQKGVENASSEKKKE